MSAGIRSGVNWTRLKSRPSALANDRAIRVLPNPGRSSISMWPSAAIATSANLSASCLPIKALVTSLIMRSA